MNNETNAKTVLDNIISYLKAAQTIENRFAGVKIHRQGATILFTVDAKRNLKVARTARKLAGEMINNEGRKAFYAKQRGAKSWTCMSDYIVTGYRCGVKIELTDDELTERVLGLWS